MSIDLDEAKEFVLWAFTVHIGSVWEHPSGGVSKVYDIDNYGCVEFKHGGIRCYYPLFVFVCIHSRKYEF